MRHFESSRAAAVDFSLLVPGFLIAALVAVLAAGCNVSDPGRPPPLDRLFFPTGAVADPSGAYLYVTNGNTDLRFTGGTLTVIDFAATLRAFAETKRLADQRQTGPCNDHDPLNPRIFVCNERLPPEGLGLILADRTVAIGNFAGQPAVQRFRQPRRDSSGQPLGLRLGCTDDCDCDPRTNAPDCVALFCHPGPDDPTCVDSKPQNARMRLLVPVRGDPSMTWINVFQDGHLDCGQGQSANPACDEAHRLSEQVIDPALSPAPIAELLAPEPFGMAVSEELGFAVTAHLSGATLSLFDVGDDPDFHPAFVSSFERVFDLSSVGSLGAYGAALRPFDPLAMPASCPPLPRCLLADFTVLYASSRFSPRIAQTTVRGAERCRPGLGTDINRDTCAGTPRYALTLVKGPDIAIDPVLLDGSDMRDLKFNRAGTRAYAVDRRPPTLLEIDTSAMPAPAGDPRNFVLRAIEVCGEPSLIALREDPPPLRVYVTCFSAGQIFVVDPDAGTVVDIIDVGRGPNAVTVVPGRPSRGVVANFADNDLAVIDLEPGSVQENIVLFKIGYPTPIVGTR